MRIAVFGSGGVGGYFGARLAAAGEDVTFIARGAHLAAMREHGLRIQSPLGNLDLPRVEASDDPEAVGPVDLVFLTVKLYDNERAMQMLPPLLGASTLVVPFQNGVESIDMLGRVIDRRHVAGGTAYVAAVVAEPGVIRHTAMNNLRLGPTEPGQLPLLEQLRDACQRAGIEPTLSTQIVVDIWAKFVRLSVFSGMTAITRCPVGTIMDDPDLLAMVLSAMRETMAVAHGKKIPLPAGLFGEVVGALRSVPPATRSSMLEDLERGRRLELPWLSGAVVRIGQEVGVETPIHRFITTVLKPHVSGRAAAGL